MCSYNITLDDTLVEQVRPSFADDKALQFWLQQQMEEILLNCFVRQVPRRNTYTNDQPIPDVVSRLLGAGLPLENDDINGRKAFYQQSGGEALMTKLFPDTNIVIDLLEKREPYCRDAVRLKSV